MKSNWAKRAAAGFTLLILVGAGLLRLPASLMPGRELSWMEALFTATSAATVTGLSVQDTASHFSQFGYWVIGVLMQVGALMAMIFSCCLLMGSSRGISGGTTGGTSGGLVWRIVRVVLGIELVGAVLLMPVYGLGGGVFHAISAFCQGGFDLTGSSMAGQRYAMSTHVVMVGLILLGGAGFPVLACRKQFPGHARVVLMTMAGLHLAGVVVLVGGELMPYVSDQLHLNVTANRTAPDLLTGRRLGAMVADASFLSVSARSAGFYAMPMDEVSSAGQVMLMGLMMVGGSPGSAAGGMHTTTLAVLLLAMWGSGRGTKPIQRLAGAMAMFFVGLIFMATCLLSLTEPFPLSRLMFEVISATTLSGLSLGITSELTTFGMAVIMMCMWMGRVWPLILLARFAIKGEGQQEQVLIG